MKLVRILRDGPIGDPGNVRASVVEAKKGQTVKLSDTAADMAVNESDPPRAEYIEPNPEPESKDEGGGEGGGDGEPGSEGEGDDEPGSGGGDRSLLDRITGKGKGESSVLE